MFKFLALLNLTGLFLFRALFLTDVMITHETPATMQAGTEVKVTVTIDKGQLNGFAKLQIDLPDGLSATAIETKGASFTFADGKAKFIWMALPTQPQFKVSYTLSAAATASGSLPINGKFSYIEDNERKTEDMPSSMVTITGGTVAQDMSTPNPTVIATAQNAVTMDNSSDVAFAGTAAPVKEAVVVSASGIAPQQGAGNVSVTRSISAVTETEMLVEVTVNKGSIRGFGKLQETIPAGFTALEKSSAEAIFTAQDRIVKFVWLNLPATEELKITYKLRANAQPEGEYTVNGEFGYLLNDETQKAVVGSTNFLTGPKALETQQQVATNGSEKAGEQSSTAQNPANNGQSSNTANTKTTETITPDHGTIVRNTEKATAGNPGSQAAANTTAQSSKTTKTAGHVPAPETGVTYKVQITAAHREVGGAYFAERHHYNGSFSIERHEGWIKYVTGHFPEYRGARDQRQEFMASGNNFPGPFVTAYNNGDRVTVQEALMISNQKWLQ